MVLHGLVLSLPPAGVRAVVRPGQMTGGEIKPAAQNRLGWKRRKLADQQQKHFLRRILRQRRIAKDTVAGRLYHRPMQGHEVGAGLFLQGKRIVPGTLRRAELAFGLLINGHTLLLPHSGKVCEKVPWTSAPHSACRVERQPRASVGSIARTIDRFMRLR